MFIIIIFKLLFSSEKIEPFLCAHNFSYFTLSCLLQIFIALFILTCVPNARMVLNFYNYFFLLNIIVQLVKVNFLFRIIIKITKIFFFSKLKNNVFINRWSNFRTMISWIEIYMLQHTCYNKDFQKSRFFLILALMYYYTVCNCSAYIYTMRRAVATHNITNDLMTTAEERLNCNSSVIIIIYY